MDRRSIQTCAVDQARFVWVVSEVSQDFTDGVRPVLHNFHVQAEESLPATTLMFLPESGWEGSIHTP